MENRGRGRARGRTRPAEGAPQQRPGGYEGQGAQGGSVGRGRGGPPPRPGGSAWGGPPQAGGPPQQGAWGRGPQAQAPPPQEGSAWGPPKLVQQQHGIRAPAPQGQQPTQAGGRAMTRGGGDAKPPGQHTAEQVGLHREGGQGQGVSQSTSRGAARAGRSLPFEDIIRTRPAHANSKKGTGGRNVTLKANYLQLTTTNKIFMLYQYRVDMAPEVDQTYHRKDYVRDAVREILTGYVFDGTVLYTQKKIHPDPLVKTVHGKNEGEVITVTIKLVGDVMYHDWHYLQVFNIIMRKCISALKLQMVSRNYFDPRAKVTIPEHKLEIWPGYFTSIRQHEREILMCVEITHKVMRLDTILNILQDVKSRSNQNYREEFNKRVISSIVMTDYNNRFYRIDDVEWKKTPRDTFSKADGTQLDLITYYKERYGKTIRILDQPLLTSRARKREIRAGAPELIYLIPELCRLTGLTDADRANFPLMKALSEYTRIGPSQRIQKLHDFIKRVRGCKEAMAELNQWDMNISQQLVEIPARVLDSETLVGGNQTRYRPDQYADWTKDLRSKPMFLTGKLDRFCVLTPSRCKHSAVSFSQMLSKAAAGMSWRIPQPKLVEIPDDRPQTYLQALHQVIQERPELVMCVVLNNKIDRYSAIKKKCTVEFAVPSQVILAKNLDSKGAMSIATKVAIQLNCKVGGAPWAVVVPASHLMVVGYDVCHDPTDKSKSIAATVASLDKTITRYFSAVSKHSYGEELSNDLGLQVIRSCIEYEKVHKCYPDRIVLYRDGVGDGQLNHVISHEVETLVQQLKTQIYKTQPLKLAYIIVSKRINTRFFAPQGNPEPGTVIDDVVTLPERYDFFISSQCVRQGTVSPTSYNIIYDTSGLSPTHLQSLSYKLTHAYFNWSGTVRVPAPCQYAHKLAFLVSQALQREPNQDLKNVLYYL